MIFADAKKYTKSRDKVLVLISDTGPSRLMMNILESTIEANLEPHVIIYDSNRTKLFDDITAIGISCEYMEYSGNRSSLALILKTIRHIKANSYRIVYASGQHATLLGISAAFIARAPKRIFTRHHSDSNFYGCGTSIRLIRGYIFDVFFNWLATDIAAVSKVVKDQMTEHEFVNSNKIVVIDNSVSDDFQIEHRKFREGDRLKIGVISRLTGLKGVKFASEAFAKYYEVNNNCELTVVGEESDSAKDVRQVLSHLPQSSYQFIAKLSDTKAFYSDIDLFIHVPIRGTAEAFGLVYLEALFSGVHCIFTKSGIISADEELTKFCKVVNFEDSNAILKEINAFANQDSDVKELPREIIERYSPEKMKESYKELWVS